MPDEPLPARVRVRVVNPDAEDNEAEGWVTNTATLQIGSRSYEFLIVQLDRGGDPVAYQQHELMAVFGV